MSDTVIKVEGLYKKFCRSLKRSMAYGLFDVSRSMVGITHDREYLRAGEFWALQDINLELKKGETLGIIGVNGSGKTTLLRLISGIFPPDKGRITITGRIGALIAVGAGFHPHMTGRENVYLNGIILGMTIKEVREKFDSIIDFADIGNFIDAPVATYSSGMTVRLGFAIAIHSRPKSMVADEVLAVGDLSFALKCYRKISEYREQGGSVILVSHGMQLIRNTCNKVMWMDNGKIREHGSTQSICDAYEKSMFLKDSLNNISLGSHINNDPATQITNVEFLDNMGKKCTEYRSGDFFKMRIFFNCKRQVKNPIFTFAILNTESIAVIANYSNFDNFENPPVIFGNGFIDLTIKELLLKSGCYLCTITFAENDLANVLDWHEKSYSFSVISKGTVAYGLFQPPTEWEFKELNSN
jgi:lipopolysaccharide transport system ATP-binding protein